MVTRLQEIKGKMDIIGKVVRGTDKEITDRFLHIMELRARLKDPFDEFYKNIPGSHALTIFNEYLPENSPLTKEDMEFFYEHKKRYARRI